MPRLQVVAPEQATGPTRKIYDQLEQDMGRVINIFQGMGNSPAALNAYLAMSAALAEGELTPEDREVIYLAVSEGNGCQYCVSAHAQIAAGTALTGAAVNAARQFQSSDPRHAALLTFLRRVIETRGFVEDGEVEAVRAAGYTDGQIAEAIGYIGLATFSNLFNHVHGTPLDFPAAPDLE